MRLKTGEVWLADLGWAGKTRPFVIISRDDSDPPRALYIYIPLTRQNRESRYEVSLGHIPWLANESVANAQGIGSLPPIRFKKRIGLLHKEDLLKIKSALIFVLSLENKSIFKIFKKIIFNKNSKLQSVQLSIHGFFYRLVRNMSKIWMNNWNL